MYSDLSGGVKAFFAGEFGPSTDLMHSDDVVEIHLEIPFDLPSQVYFRLIAYGDYDTTQKTVTCIENCGSFPTTSLTE